MRLPSAGRNVSGMAPSSSMVRYEMQRRASSSYGATMARVGHASMHAVQLPQWLLTGASTGSGRSVNISPRKNHEPS